MITLAHYPEVHNQTGRGYSDNDPTNARCLCGVDHAIEELRRDNLWGAQKLLDMGVFTTKHAKKIGKQIYMDAEKLRVFAANSKGH